MIQRKQTLFLLAITIIGIILFFLPFQKTILSNDLGTCGLSFMGGCGPAIHNGNDIYPKMLNFLVIILSVFTIFLFKKRTIQYKLSNFLALLNVFITGLFFLLTYTKNGVIGETHFSFGAFLPIVSVFFALLAAHFIKKDEQLVRNSDRIR